MRKGINLVRAAMLALLLLNALLPAGGQSPKAQQSPQAAAQPGKSPAQIPTAAPVDAAFVIGPEDVLAVDVWKEPEITRTVPVRPDGKISLPLLGDVQASGLTASDLGASITEKLKKYISNPQVTVIVSVVNSQRIYVMGEVNHGGAFPLLPNMTVMQALSSAGGFTQFANLKNVYVLRNENGKQVKYPFNYKEAIKGKRLDQDILLKPGDTIIVP